MDGMTCHGSACAFVVVGVGCNKTRRRRTRWRSFCAFGSGVLLHDCNVLLHGAISFCTDLCFVARRNVRVPGAMLIWPTELSPIARLSVGSPTGKRALYVANAILNRFSRDARATWSECRALAAEVLLSTGRAHDSTSLRPAVFAVGHCHIDTAWLWPFDETRRKVTRSWVTMVRYMQSHPKFVFVASQAQQFAWLQRDQPGVFARVKDAVGTGRFATVGVTTRGVPTLAVLGRWGGVNERAISGFKASNAKRWSRRAMLRNSQAHHNRCKR